MKLYEIFKKLQFEKNIATITEEKEFDIWDYVRQVNGKWALVSKKTGKPLEYFKGNGKPSQRWVDKVLKRVEYFKHHK